MIFQNIYFGVLGLHLSGMLRDNTAQGRERERKRETERAEKEREGKGEKIERDYKRQFLNSEN